MAAHARSRRLAAAVVVLAVLVVSTASAKRAPRVHAPHLPRHHLTPGAHVAASPARVCALGYAVRVRAIPASRKARVFARYGIRRARHAYTIDRLVSLGLGGSNAVTNLWPERTHGRWGARTKNRLEQTLHRLVCSGRLSLTSARRQEAHNWIKAYKRYVRAAGVKVGTSAPSVPAPVGGAPSEAPLPAPAELTGTIRAAFYYP